MVSYKERERLTRNLRDDPAYGLGVVFKCAACLILLVVIAVIGTRGEMQSEVQMAASTQTAATQR